MLEVARCVAQCWQHLQLCGNPFSKCALSCWKLRGVWLKEGVTKSPAAEPASSRCGGVPAASLLPVGHAPAQCSTAACIHSRACMFATTRPGWLCWCDTYVGVSYAPSPRHTRFSRITKWGCRSVCCCAGPQASVSGMLTRSLALIVGASSGCWRWLSPSAATAA